jgi:hypothetical protein
MYFNSFYHICSVRTYFPSPHLYTYNKYLEKRVRIGVPLGAVQAVASVIDRVQQVDLAAGERAHVLHQD